MSGRVTSSAIGLLSLLCGVVASELLDSERVVSAAITRAVRGKGMLDKARLHVEYRMRLMDFDERWSPLTHDRLIKLVTASTASLLASSLLTAAFNNRKK